MKVVKRNGKTVDFDKSKIQRAVTKAFIEVDGKESEQSKFISDLISLQIQKENRNLSVEEIQDMVVDLLMNTFSCRQDVAVAYIQYRYKRKLVREHNTTDKTIMEIVDGANEYYKGENSNKNPKLNTTIRDYVAGESSKDITERILLPSDILEADNKGIIHFHDKDYFLQHMHNCDLINLEDMLQNGTVISEVMIEKPKSFSTACNIATQIIAQVASSQYGGQSISLTHLAPFIDISRQKIRDEVIEERIENGDELDKEKIEKVVDKRLRKEIERGAQTIQYQVVTLMTTNGQAPFITVFMYLNEAKDEQTKKDLALLIEEVLKQREQGVKNEVGAWISPAFPKLIYVLQDDNSDESGEYWYLTKLAARCSAKRLTPDYISEKIMKEVKDGNCFPVMGCVEGKEVISYKIAGTLYVESFEMMWERLSLIYSPKFQDGRDNDMYMDLSNVSIYDSEKDGFVKTNRIIRNLSSDWVSVEIEHGRYLACTSDHPFHTVNRGRVYAKDLIAGEDLVKLSTYSCCSTYNKINPEYAKDMAKYVGYNNEQLPSLVFTLTMKSRIFFLMGMIETIGDISKDDEGYAIVAIRTTNKELSLQIINLLETLEMFGEIKKLIDVGVTYEVSFYINAYLRDRLELDVNETKIKPINLSDYSEAKILSVKHVAITQYSYDVTTESDHFTVSGIYSHNCRSALNVYKDENGDPKFYGRFNQGVVTLSLPHIALSSNGDIDKFWELFEERTELCHKALKCRHDRLLGTLSDVAPILWRYGALSRLDKGEQIDKLLFDGYSSISLGYAGLYEAVKYMTGCSHSDEGIGEKFGLEIMQALNHKCDKWKEEENIAYSIYGTPLESTTYKFAKCLRDQFGIIEGITDRDYITNSYHIPVFEQIDAFEKLRLEAKFQRLSPGGAISYIETPDMKNNIPALLEIIKYMYNNIMYAEINTKSDYCQICGYDGEMSIIDDNNKLIWECPNCGNRDTDKLDITRRTCGYIGTARNGWNQGRMDEIAHRVLHLDDIDAE